MPLTPAECGRRCRKAFCESSKGNWGEYSMRGRKITFRHKTVFALYSDYNPLTSVWFYGVPSDEWQDWQDQLLLILMKEADEVNYTILQPKETVSLLSRCGQDRIGDKKIHVRRPTGGGRLYFVEWQDFPLHNRIAPLRVRWDA